MKERYRKQQFLKNLGLRTNKNNYSSSYNDEDETNPTIDESECFYYFDDNLQVICRGCFNNFSTWLDYRKHFTPNRCHTTRSDYKMNTYNDVYKNYKLKKAKSKKKINDRLSAAHLMDYETLNTRKTRKRCYVNARIVSNKTEKSAISNSQTTEKESMEENIVDTTTAANNNGKSSNAVKNVSDYKAEMSSNENNLDTHRQAHDIPKSAKNNSVPNSLKILSAVQCVKVESNVVVKAESNAIVKAESNAIVKAESNVVLKAESNVVVKAESNVVVKAESNVVVKAESNVLKAVLKAQTAMSTLKNSALGNSKRRPAQSKIFKRFGCVVCHQVFLSKTMLTSHQVQHIKVDHNLFSIFMAGNLQRAESS